MARQELGPYRLMEKIGSGTTASVYRAEQTSLGRQVVLKVLYPHLSEDPRFLQRFQTEARAVAALDHENVVRVIDFGRHEDVSYIAMELVEGEDLRRCL